MIRINTENRHMGNDEDKMTYDCQVYSEPWWERVGGNDKALDVESRVIIMGLAETRSNIEAIPVDYALTRLQNIIFSLLEEEKGRDNIKNEAEWEE